MNTDEFLAKPYSDRQLVVFVNDEIYAAKQKAEQQEQEQSTAQKISYTALSILASSFNVYVALATIVYTAWERAKTKGLNVNILPKSLLSNFILPIGHPQENMVYAAHPASPSHYLPLSDFHKKCLEHKFSEAVTLLMNLGAKTISVYHINGYGKDFTANLSAILPDQSSSTIEGGKSTKQTSQLLYDAKFDNDISPKLPENLVWFPFEDTWQQIANARLDFGLKTFNLILDYDEDFGINGQIKAEMEKTGFKVGSSFTEHKATTWKISGNF